jgi:hypothetical protein
VPHTLYCCTSKASKRASRKEKTCMPHTHLKSTPVAHAHAQTRTSERTHAHTHTQHNTTHTHTHTHTHAHTEKHTHLDGQSKCLSGHKFTGCAAVFALKALSREGVVLILKKETLRSTSVPKKSPI